MTKFVIMGVCYLL